MSLCVEKDCTRPAIRRRRCATCYARKRRSGVYGYRDATRTRDRISRLRDLGWTWPALGDAAGMSPTAVLRIFKGERSSVQPETERAIHAVPLIPYSSNRSLDPTGARRRLQSLRWMGWPTARVAERIGVSVYTLRTCMQKDRAISFALHYRLAAVFEELHMQPGPSAHVAAMAKKAGALPPLAWGELIDLPDDDLQIEVGRQVALMDDDDLRRWNHAYQELGDRSPLAVAAAGEWRRVLKARKTEAASPEEVAA